MKTTTYTVIIAILISLAPNRVHSQTKSVKVGFILANLFVERWQKEKDYFETRVNELGGTVIFKDCYDQVDNQIVAAKELIEEKVDIIVIIAVDAVATAPIVDFSKKAGIPVVAYDRLILNTALDYYITFNSVKVGEMMAQSVVDILPKGDILYLGGPSDDHNSVFIRKGVFNILKPLKDNYDIHSTQVSSWTELDAYLQIQDYLSNNNRLPDAIICAADILTRGAVGVVMENNMLGKVILTGQDAELDICKYLLDDIVYMTIYKPGKTLAERAADEVWKILEQDNYELPTTINNGTIDVPSVLLEPQIVTKNSLDETVIKDGYYTKADIFGE